MNIWIERIIVASIGGALTLLLKFLYDWKIKLWISKSHKKHQEKEEKKEKEKQQKINELNKKWKISREALQSMREPLMRFNSMNRYQSNEPAKQCLQWASQIQGNAEKIQFVQYKEIKDKLLKYADRINQTDQNSRLKHLMNLFQKKVKGKYEPLVLWDEIESTLKATSKPPYSENDI